MTEPTQDIELNAKEVEVVDRLVRYELGDRPDSIRAVLEFRDTSDENALDLEIWDTESLVQRIGTDPRWWSL